MATKVKTGVIDSSAITSALIANASITADDLHTTLDLTGKTVTVATATAGDNDTSVASTAFVSTAIANLADSAPSTLNTLNELAAALGDDASFSTTVTNSIALKAPLASPSLTGTVTVTGASSAYNTLQLTSNSTGHGTIINLGDTSDADYGSITQFASSAGEGGRMRFIAGTTETMNLKGGNVGIGETDPDKRLHIKSNSVNNSMIKIESTATNSYPGIQIVNDAQAWEINTHGGHSDALTFYNGTTHTVALATGGNVGIGTTSPDTLLHLSNNGTTPGIIRIERNDTTISDTNVYGGIEFEGQDGSAASAAGVRGKILGVAEGASGEMALTFETAAGYGSSTERMRINSSGNVGIGTATPATILHAKASGDAELRLEAGTNSDARVRFGDATDNDLGYIGFNRNSGYMNFSINNTQGEHMRIDSSGRVGIGTSSPSSILEISKAGEARLKVTSTNNNWAGLDLEAHGSQSNYMFFRDNGAERARIQVTDGEEIYIQSGSSSDQQLRLRKQQSTVDSMHAGFGCTPSGDITIQCQGNGATWRFGSNVGNGNSYWLNSSNSGVYMGNGNNSWSAHSDERLKENITDIGPVLDIIQDYRCVKFNFKSNPGKEIIGFIAQDWETDFPEVVDEDDAFTIQDDGTLAETFKEENTSTIKAKSIAYTETIPVLLKAIQEQQIIIEDLKTRIETLEG